MKRSKRGGGSAVPPDKSGPSSEKKTAESKAFEFGSIRKVPIHSAYAQTQATSPLNAPSASPDGARPTSSFFPTLYQ